MWADSSEMVPLVTRTVLAVPCPEPAPFELLTYATVSCYRDVCAALLIWKAEGSNRSPPWKSPTPCSLSSWWPRLSPSSMQGFPLQRGKKLYDVCTYVYLCAHAFALQRTSGNQRAVCRGPFSSWTMWVRGLNSGLRGWQQVPIPWGVSLNLLPRKTLRPSDREKNAKLPGVPSFLSSGLRLNTLTLVTPAAQHPPRWSSTPCFLRKPHALPRVRGFLIHIFPCSLLEGSLTSTSLCFFLFIVLKYILVCYMYLSLNTFSQRLHSGGLCIPCLVALPGCFQFELLQTTWPWVSCKIYLHYFL